MTRLTFDQVTELINMLRSDDLSIRVLAMGIIGKDPAIVDAFNGRRLANEFRTRLGGIYLSQLRRKDKDFKEWVSDVRYIYDRLVQYHNLPTFHKI